MSRSNFKYVPQNNWKLIEWIISYFLRLQGPESNFFHFSSFLTKKSLKVNKANFEHLKKLICTTLRKRKVKYSTGCIVYLFYEVLVKMFCICGTTLCLERRKYILTSNFQEMFIQVLMAQEGGSGKLNTPF